jgi:hypothetical protein
MVKLSAGPATRRRNVKSSKEKDFYVQELIRFHNLYNSDPGYQKSLREVWKMQSQPFYHEALRKLGP